MKLFLALEARRGGDVWILIGQTDDDAQVEHWRQMHSVTRGYTRVLVVDAPDLRCTECGDPNLQTYVTKVNRSGVSDGRLRLHDVTVLEVTGCARCSETVAVRDLA